MTTTQIKLLDLSRTVGIGESAILILLEFDPDRGYLPLGTLDGGWEIELGGINQVQTMILVEHDGVDSSVLARVRAFSVDGAIYEVVSGYKVQSPEPNSPVREWQFQVAPTGEQLSI